MEELCKSWFYEVFANSTMTVQQYVFRDDVMIATKCPESI